MPWLPELFSAPVLQQLEERAQRKLVTVPFFDGLMAGEFDALVGSFATEPVLHHPRRGRIRGVHEFEVYVAETTAWFRERNITIEDIQHVHHGRRGFGEGVLHVDDPSGSRKVDVPVAIVADRHSDGRIEELRIYYSGWPLTGQHLNRPPLLQPDPHLRLSDVVARYQAALSAGDADAIVAAFESDGYAQEPAGAEYVHRDPDGLRHHYRQLFANGGGIPLEHCTLTDNNHACALEYNVVRWGRTELPPQAGVAVYVRGQSGKLAAVRIYDDVNPPVSTHR